MLNRLQRLKNSIRIKRAAVVSIIALSMVGLPAASNATTITFEDLPAMVNTPGTAVPLASQLTNQYLSSYGVSFTSLGGYAAVVNHGPGNATASYPNIIGGTDASGHLNYNSSIKISFFDVTNLSVDAVTDTFKIQGDWVPLGYGYISATAYGATGNVLGTTSDTDNKPGPVLQFNIAGIHSVVISGSTGTVGFDQLEFGALSAVNSVPEPSTLLLLGSGLVGLVGMRRRFKA